MCHPLTLCTDVMLFEVNMLIEATMDTREELEKRWAIARAACFKFTRESVDYIIPPEMADVETYCYQVLSETWELIL